MASRIRRERQDLLEALQRNVRLLEQFSERAFGQGDLDYLGEVAGKLRLLISPQKYNKPLLIALMDEFGADIPVTLDELPVQPSPGRPSPGRQISLQEFLSLPAYGIRSKAGRWLQLNKLELIQIWAQQHGAAHEDWELDEAFILARDSGLFIGGRPALTAELKLTTLAVLEVARRFLAGLEGKEL